jgi:hypothetical protein
MTQMVECLSSKHKVLSTNPTTMKKRGKVVLIKSNLGAG